MEGYLEIIDFRSFIFACYNFHFISYCLCISDYFIDVMDTIDSIGFAYSKDYDDYSMEYANSNYFIDLIDSSNSLEGMINYSELYCFRIMELIDFSFEQEYSKILINYLVDFTLGSHLS